MCHQALQRAQTCCIICRNGNRFLHEEGTCCWAMHGYQKGRSRIRGCRKPPCVPPGLNGLFAERASGGRWDRPELHRLFDQLRPRDVVVVWKLDRLSRSLKDLLHLMERITHAGAGFRSLTEAIDTTTPAGRMLMQMVGSFAEFERAMIRERTQVGLVAARARGRIGGRRPKLGPQQQAAIVEMVHAGRQSQADAARLFRGHPATVSRLLAVYRQQAALTRLPTDA
jgi:DNA invertase Pin-like site-specific DNA recombinase